MSKLMWMSRLFIMMGLVVGFCPAFAQAADRISGSNAKSLYEALRSANVLRTSGDGARISAYFVRELSCELVGSNVECTVSDANSRDRAVSGESAKRLMKALQNIFQIENHIHLDKFACYDERIVSAAVHFPHMCVF